MRAKRSLRALPWLLALLMVVGQTHAVVHAVSHIDFGTDHALQHDHGERHDQNHEHEQHTRHNHAGASHSDLTCKLCAAGHATLPVAALPLIPPLDTPTLCALPDTHRHTAPREQYLCRDPPRAG